SGLGRRPARIDKHGDACGGGHQLAHELQALCRQLSTEDVDASQVAAGPGEAGDKAEPDRVFGNAEDDGIVVVASLAAEAACALATITLTGRRTNSAASSGSRSPGFSVQR